MDQDHKSKDWIPHWPSRFEVGPLLDVFYMVDLFSEFDMSGHAR